MKTRAALLALILAACLFFPARLPAEEYTNSLGMEFVLIGPGSFVMGSGQNADSDEGPPHQVEITRPFFLGKFEVTQAQYEALTHDNPSQFKNPDSPADSVTWEQAVSFIAALNKKEGTDAYRLPTEAEW
jgi:formylglycine-generating enzyme required for sulfatase activity